MEILENCEICGKQINILDEKEGYNIIISDFDESLIPYDCEWINCEVWMCCDCWKNYVELVKLKVMWHWLVFINQIYLTIYQPPENLKKEKCCICGENFIKTHGNQKYCPKCKVEHRKYYKREHAREQYRKKHVYNRKAPICKRCGKPITTDDDLVEFVHGNTQYHTACFINHRSEYQDLWALNWFKKNWWILDPRRGIFKYSYYSLDRYKSALYHNGIFGSKKDGSRGPYLEYKYIMGTLCYNCHEVGAFKTIKSYKEVKKDGKTYRTKIKKCSNCGKTHVSVKEVKIYDDNMITNRKLSRIKFKI